MKSVQISEELFFDLARYHLLDQRDEELTLRIRESQIRIFPSGSAPDWKQNSTKWQTEKGIARASNRAKPTKTLFDNQDTPP